MPTVAAPPQLREEGKTRIAFIKNGAIWTMALDSSQMRQVVECKGHTGLCYIEMVSVSPDGGKIAYAYYPEGGAQYGQETVLACINSDGSEETTLLKRTGPSISSLVWSPASTKLAFSEWNQTREPSNEHGTWLIDLKTGQHTLLLPWIGSEWGHHDTDVAFAEVRWSPDGNLLIVLIGSVAPEGGGSVNTYIADPEGRELKLIKSGCSLIEWSPDRKRILFNCGQPLWWGTEVWMTNTDGSGTLCLTPKEIWDGATNNPWSPDGKYILVLSLREEDFDLWPCIPYHLWIVNVDDKARRQLTSDDNFCEGSAFWSPDGTRIVFQRIQRCELENDRWSIWSIKPDGSALKKLADGRLCDVFLDGDP